MDDRLITSKSGLNPAAPDDVTGLLQRWHEGDREALDALVPFVYEELRRVAHAHMRREHGDRTLGTTALIHEAYLNLAGPGSKPAFESRTHFFGVASQVMRRVLVWRARARQAEKRGSGVRPEPLSPDHDSSLDEELDQMLAIDAALEQLERSQERWVRVVECRYFTGLTIPETAEALDISMATVKRDWEGARAWLRTHLER